LKNNGKLAILTAIMSQEGLFSTALIMDATGLSRQLVTHHLERLVESSCLIKQSLDLSKVRYLIVDKDSLYREANLILETTSTGSKAIDTLLWKHASALNDVVRVIKQAQVLELPNHKELRTTVIEQINETINSLRRAKKNLIDSKTSYETAKKQVNKANEDNETWLKEYLEWLKTFQLAGNESAIRASLIELEH